MLLQGERCAFAKRKIINGLACSPPLAWGCGGGGCSYVVGVALIVGFGHLVRVVVHAPMSLCGSGGVNIIMRSVAETVASVLLVGSLMMLNIMVRSVVRVVARASVCVCFCRACREKCVGRGGEGAVLWDNKNTVEEMNSTTV